MHKFIFQIWIFFCEMRDSHNFGEIGPRTKYVLYVHDFVTLWG